MTPAQIIGIATVAAVLAGVQWIARNTRTTPPAPPAWTFYNARMTGEPRAVCTTCGLILAYWDADDLDAHTEWHNEETAQ